MAGWSAVYYSSAFDRQPRHWNQVDWPRGLRDRIEPTKEYFEEVIDWFETFYRRWLLALQGSDDLQAPKRVHWGGSMPALDIVTMVASHWVHHAGEINAILAIRRAEAWEYSEEVEENHISTIGYRVRPHWMNDEEASRFEREERRERH